MKAIWRKRLYDILRWPALAVGAAATTITGANASTDRGDGIHGKESPDLEPVILPNTLNVTADDRYAAHRSHSSHRSHRSHRSSGGGGYAPPSTMPAPRTTPPSIDVPKPSPQNLSMMVVRVQAALMRLGYYNGDIDGLLGPETRSAITEFQKAKGLRPTGRMDINTLTKLGIAMP